MRNPYEEGTVDEYLKKNSCNYTMSTWWHPISLKETPMHGEVGNISQGSLFQSSITQDISDYFFCVFFFFTANGASVLSPHWPHGYAITSFICHRWRRCGRGSLGANQTESKASWTPLKWKPLCNLSWRLSCAHCLEGDKQPLVQP